MSGSFLEPIDDGTVRLQVARRLSHHIVTGNFAPGQRLTERDLAESLQVSRGSVREAVRDLVQIGLLESRPYRGLYVRTVSRRNLEELYSLRTTLESFAFERLWPLRTSENLADLAARNAALVKTVEDGGDGLRAIEQELHLHNWCYEFCDHGLLRQSWASLRPHVHFYFSLHQKAHHRKGPLRESHDVYVRLAGGEKLEDMLSHLKEHMRQGLSRTMAALSGTLPD